jgi:hypothetical protein
MEKYMLGANRIGANRKTGLQLKLQKSTSLNTSSLSASLTSTSLTRAARNGTLATATPLGSFPPGKRTVKGTVGQGNSTDFLQLELTANGRIRVLLANNSQGRLTGAVLNANGATVATAATARGTRQTSELLVKGAKPGTYYIRIKGPASGNNRYTVNLFVNRTNGPAPLPCGCGT